MPNLLKVAEVVDIGIEKEKARRDFYAQVADQFEDGDVKDLFTRLRDWEEGHVKKFQAIRDGLNEPGAVESYPGEMEAYMQALVDDELYQDVSADTFVEYVKTPKDAIIYGIGFEKDAILLFMELASMVQSKDKQVIMDLMQEERQHIVQLIKLRKKYS